MQMHFCDKIFDNQWIDMQLKRMKNNENNNS